MYIIITKISTAVKKGSIFIFGLYMYKQVCTRNIIVRPEYYHSENLILRCIYTFFYLHMLHF